MLLSILLIVTGAWLALYENPTVTELAMPAVSVSFAALTIVSYALAYLRVALPVDSDLTVLVIRLLASALPWVASFIEGDAIVRATSSILAIAMATIVIFL
jgi:hypothetical protein